jgi:hypothetical protein
MRANLLRNLASPDGALPGIVGNFAQTQANRCKRGR